MENTKTRTSERRAGLPGVFPVLWSSVAAVLILFFLAGCSSGPRIELDPEAQAFYDQARLVMTGEEKDTERLERLRRRPRDVTEGRYLVFFEIDKVLPLVGTEEAGSDCA